MIVRMTPVDWPSPKTWNEPAWMLARSRDGHAGSGPDAEGIQDGDELISVHGEFPVFRSLEDARKLLQALRESTAYDGVRVVRVTLGVGQACEIRFGKPVHLVDVTVEQKT